MTDTMIEPKDCFYTSHGLRLHYVDWGNESAPPLLLIHGGGDHCRSWDRLARELRPHFHVIAPDLRGHGDSDWTKGGSYALTEYVYDIVRLFETLGIDRAKIVGHSMGGMVSLIFSGTYPDKVEKLVVLDGVTILPDATRAPTHERILRSVAQLGEREGKIARGYATIEEAAVRMKKRNTRLTDDLALHLTIMWRSGRVSHLLRCCCLPTAAFSTTRRGMASCSISRMHARKRSSIPDIGCSTISPRKCWRRSADSLV